MQAAEQHRALNLWRLATVASVRRDGPDLTARQMAILLTAYLTPPPHTVRGLAETMGISKPAVTRALDRLGELGFRCELHRTEISLLERGGREPRLGTIVKLAGALDTTPEALCDGIRWNTKSQKFTFKK